MSTELRRACARALMIVCLLAPLLVAAHAAAAGRCCGSSTMISPEQAAAMTVNGIHRPGRTMPCGDHQGGHCAGCPGSGCWSFAWLIRRSAHEPRNMPVASSPYTAARLLGVAGRTGPPALPPPRGNA